MKKRKKCKFCGDTTLENFSDKHRTTCKPCRAAHSKDVHSQAFRDAFDRQQLMDQHWRVPTEKNIAELTDHGSWYKLTYSYIQAQK